MALKMNPPQYKKEKGYERYKTELLAWREITDIKDEKQGIVVALSLPENDDSGIRERVFDELTIEDLKKTEGLNTLTTFMDKHLGKDDLSDSFEKYEEFEECKREAGQSIIEFISKFDQRYNRILKLDMKIPSAVLAFMLLKKCNITKEEKMLVLTGMDYGEKNTLYEQAKKSLVKFKGEQGGGATSNLSRSTAAAIKLEPAYVTADDEALWNAGYVKRGRGGSRGYRPWHRGSLGGSGRGNTEYKGTGNNQMKNGSYDSRNVNPKGPDGSTLLCKACGSFRHLIAKCPDSWENRANVKITESENDHYDDETSCKSTFSS